MLRSWGLKVRDLPGCAEKRYLAGEDLWRAERLNELFADPEVSGVLCVRGGYGSVRIRDHLDLDLVRANPKLFVGFSDLTILLNRFVQEAGMVAYHGPMVATDLPRMTEKSRERFRRFLFGEDGWYDTDTGVAWRGGKADGNLVGGCLSVIVTTLGTPEAVDTRGCVLFLEDIAERPYRIDRMLMHLRHAGKFDEVAGVVFGAMKDCDAGAGPDILREIALEAFEGFSFPVTFGFDAGHLSNHVVLPFGIRVRLDADAGHLELLESAHAA